jgi:hypothetical protein
MTARRASTLGRLVLLVALVTGMAAPLAAQQLTGTLEVKIADTSGGVLPGASVELASKATGITQTQVTGPNGTFVFSALNPGTYIVRSTLEGFKATTRTVEVALNATARIELILEVGAMNESVVVTAEISTVNTVTAQVATNVNAKEIVDLPNINRDITQLVELMPGVRQVQGTTAGGSQVVDISGNYSLGNGTRRSQSIYYVDGSENMGARRNQGLQMPNPDTVAEVQIVSSSASAEFGKEPGISLNAITKSGTNDLHGTAFYAFHNAQMNANTWAANRAGTPVPKDGQKWMGGTAGGPIIKNRTFYFGSYQRYQDDQAGQNSTNRFPTPEMMNGDFSAIPLFSIKSIDPTTGQPVGSRIPSYLMNPIAAKLKTRFPTVDAYNNSLRYFWSFQRQIHNNEYLVKVDHTFTGTQRIAVSYLTTKGAQVRPDSFAGLENAIPGWGGTPSSGARQHTASVRHTWVPSDHVVAESRVAMSRLSSTRTRSELGENLGTLGAPWPTVTPGVEQTLPSIFFTGGPSGRGGQLSDTVQNNYRVLSSLTWNKGNHMMKFGGEGQYSEFSRLLNYDNGQIFFTGAYANTAGPVNGPWPTLSNPSGDNTFAYAWADFLLGRLSRVVATGVSDNNMGGAAYFFFAQDDWRVSPKLTLTPGLRYELYGTQTSSAQLAGYVEGHQSNQYANAPLGLAFEGDTGVPDGFRRPDRNNIAPRLGVAYDVRGDGKIAIRAGGGLYYAYPPLAMIEVLADTVGAPTITGNNGSLSDPWGTSRANSGDTVCQFPNCAPPSFSRDPAQRTFTPVSINGFEDGLDTPYQYQFNASAQWEAIPGIVLGAGYIGTRARNGFMARDINLPVWTPTASTGNVNARRPNQVWRAINMFTNDSKENYDAGQFTATVRRNRTYARVTYTLQKSMASGDSEGQEVGITNAPADWADNPRDIYGEMARVTPTHVIRGAFTYDLPQWKSQPVLDAVFGNWQIAGNMSWNNGDYLNVTTGTDSNFDGFSPDRPDQTGTITYPGEDMGDGVIRWVARDAFALPPTPTADNPYPWGTTPRNAVHGPGAFFMDAALTKNFTGLPKGMRVQLRIDAQNVLNHTNLSNPNLSIASTDFGIIRTRTGGGRTVQIQTKVIF